MPDFAIAWLAGGTAAYASALWWVRRSYTLVTVSGPSMEPTFRSGDRVLVRRVSERGLARKQVVVVHDLAYARMPFSATARPHGHRRGGMNRNGPCLIKRVAAVPGDPVPRETVPALRNVPERVVPAGRIVLLGDNDSASYDSRDQGYFATEHLLGRVAARLAL
jgi:signal peptidase I